MNANRIRTRVAPSPTGFLHLGTARTALFNYLFAKKNGGDFFLRIEDTDKARSTKEFEENILTGLDQLGLQHDAFYRQSERTTIYKSRLEELINSNQAYVSSETSGERREVIRLKNLGAKIAFTDLIHGEIVFNTADLGDFVIAKSLEEPLFHLAVVVDDAEMAITHVIRGEDHISNTARQILIQEALGYQRPEYAHFPLILAPDRSKLSKRHGATALSDYLTDGYLPAALLNFMALLGWSPQAKTSTEEGTDREVFTLKELIGRFSLEAIQKNGAVFNLEKLNWLNHQHLIRLNLNEQINYLAQVLPRLDKNILAKITPLILDRANNFEEIKKMESEGELAYFFVAPEPNRELLRNPDHLPKIIELLETIDEKDWLTERIKNTLWDFATQTGRGEVLWPLRVALSGKEKSPDPFTLASILGRVETIRRIKNSI